MNNNLLINIIFNVLKLKRMYLERVPKNQINIIYRNSLELSVNVLMMKHQHNNSIQYLLIQWRPFTGMFRLGIGLKLQERKSMNSLYHRAYHLI